MICIFPLCILNCVFRVAPLWCRRRRFFGTDDQKRCRLDRLILGGMLCALVLVMLVWLRFSATPLPSRPLPAVDFPLPSRGVSNAPTVAAGVGPAPSVQPVAALDERLRARPGPASVP